MVFRAHLIFVRAGQEYCREYLGDEKQDANGDARILTVWKWNAISRRHSLFELGGVQDHHCFAFTLHHGNNVNECSCWAALGNDGGGEFGWLQRFVEVFLFFIDLMIQELVHALLHVLHVRKKFLREPGIGCNSLQISRWLWQRIPLELYLLAQASLHRLVLLRINRLIKRHDLHIILWSISNWCWINRRVFHTLRSIYLSILNWIYFWPYQPKMELNQIRNSK